MKVLIIDDEEDTRSIASMSLSILGGVDVMEAEGGLEGIAKAEQDRPDAILLDMMMPVMDGIATLGELQKNPRTNDIPVIFLTAKAMSTEIDRLIRMGAIAVLTKPFDPTTLANQVENILQTRGLKVTPHVVSATEAAYNSNSTNMATVSEAPAPQMPPSNQQVQQTQQVQQAPQVSQYQTGPYVQAPQPNYNPQSNSPQQQPYQGQSPNYGGQISQQNMQPGNYGEPSQQQRLAQQSVTSDYLVPSPVNLRKTQPDIRVPSPLSHNDMGRQGQGQGQGYGQGNGTFNGQSPSPQNQQDVNQQPQAPQPWINHQPPQIPYDGQQQWSPQPLVSQNLDSTPTRPNYNEQNYQQPPYTVPNQGGAANQQAPDTNTNLDHEQRTIQSATGQISPLPLKRLTLEELHYQQSITDGYPPHQRRNANHLAGTGTANNSANNSANNTANGPQNGATQARPPEKNPDSDPWVAAANANVQSTSAKFIAPKITAPPAEKPAPTKAVKPPAAKPPDEPRQMKFSHPWGPAKAPNWSVEDQDLPESSQDRDDE